MEGVDGRHEAGGVGMLGLAGDWSRVEGTGREGKRRNGIVPMSWMDWLGGIICVLIGVICFHFDLSCMQLCTGMQLGRFS